MGDLVAVFDTETSGLPDDPDARVVEVGMALFDLDRWDPVRTFSSFVRPEVPLTEQGRWVVQTVSGIDPELLDMAPPASAVSAWLEAATGGAPLLAYNMEFDRPMTLRSFSLDAIFAREHYAGDAAEWRTEPRCIMQALMQRFRVMSRVHEDGRPRFFSLSKAAGIADVEFEGPAHRALTDAVVAGRIYLRLLAGLTPPEMPICGIIRPPSKDEILAQTVRNIVPGTIPSSPMIRGGGVMEVSPVIRPSKLAQTVLSPKIRVGGRS